MVTTIQASQGYSLYPGSGRWVFTFLNGVQLLAVVANFGAGAQGAAIDTAATANGVITRVQELLQSS